MRMKNMVRLACALILTETMGTTFQMWIKHQRMVVIQSLTLDIGMFVSVIYATSDAVVVGLSLVVTGITIM
jgi:plasmid maintenance system antidote protein VapI